MIRSFAVVAALGVMLAAGSAFAAPQQTCSFHHDRCVATATKAAATGGQVEYKDEKTGETKHAPLTPAMCDAEKTQCLQTGQWVGPATHNVKTNILKE